jgi:hypothetical protein
MVSLSFSDINVLAVLIAWVIHIIMGLIWFSPVLFGKEWSRLTGKELAPDHKWIVPGFIGHLLMILVLALLIKHTNATTGFSGLFLGLLAWVGFIVPMETGELVWERIPFRLFLLRTGNQLIGIAVSGFILGAWR